MMIMTTSRFATLMNVRQTLRPIGKIPATTTKTTLSRRKFKNEPAKPAIQKDKPHWPRDFDNPVFPVGAGVGCVPSTTLTTIQTLT
jgi:hypothetical protein